MKRNRRVDAAEARAALAERRKRRDRRYLIRGGIALAVLLPLGAFGLRHYERKAAERRDLSVIGNGLPTVVQIFDYRCAECSELRDNVSAVQSAYSDRIQFRIAERSRADGAILATRHNADHLTLLFFGPDGRLRHTEVGMRDSAQVRALVESVFPASGARR